jgi:hypothetical protein
MPLQSTSGAATYDAFGSAAADRVYIEDVFSTYLYAGNGSTQTITNGINLSTKGGLVWLKGRSGATDHALYDTTRGTTKDLVSNSTAAETTQSTGLTAFNTTGFSIGALAKLNTNAATYVSWTFRKQPKFFDVVTWTGDGTNNRAISHSLSSVPGMIIIKSTSDVANWVIYQQNQGTSMYATMGSSSFQTDTGGAAISTPTSSSFYVAKDRNVSSNTNGSTYVAYLFAHNAGGFGLSGTDNVISCGSYTGNGSATGPTITLGYEPQWLLIKGATTSGEWYIIDNMRGLPVGSDDNYLSAGTSAAETTISEISPTSTGFQVNSTDTTINRSGYSFIYIAIRRGPMKVPTSGTSVFSPTVYAGNSSTQSITGFGFSPDLSILKSRDQGYPENVYDRLRGIYRRLETPYTNAESTQTTGLTSFDQDGISIGSLNQINTSPFSHISWNFKRAPGFFDVVCYTGTGSATTFSHNLGVVPELMIVKKRSAADDWAVYANNDNTDFLLLNTTAATADDNTYWNDTSPTASVFTVGTNADVNMSAATYVAYLFATVAGVSKVGSYTGSGTTKQIDCGFTGGARFILIKRTDSTGDWYVYDSARGIVAGNDPYFLLNTGDAEVTSTDYVDTYSAGFELSSTAPAGLNANGGTFVFLAVA